MKCAIKDCKETAKGFLMVEESDTMPAPHMLVPRTNARCKTHLTEEESWPKVGDRYFYINSISEQGPVNASNWGDDATDYARRDFLGVFKTREEAERKLTLVKTLLPTERWIPRHGQTYYVYVGTFGVTKNVWGVDNNGSLSLQELYVVHGNAHRTKEEAEAYGKILEEAAKDILK